MVFERSPLTAGSGPGTASKTFHLATNRPPRIVPVRDAYASRNDFSGRTAKPAESPPRPSKS